MNNLKFVICVFTCIVFSGLDADTVFARNLRLDTALSKQSNSPIREDYQRRIRNQEMALQNKVDKSLVNALENIENDPKTAEVALEHLANKAVQADGIKDNVDIELYNSDTMTPEQLAEVEVLGKKHGKDEFGGFYDPKSRKIYLNAAKMDGSRSQISGILANELTHYVDHKKGRTFDQGRQELSNEQQQNMLKQFEGYNGKDVMSQKEKQGFQENIRGQDFSEGNINAGGVENPQPKTTVYSRSVKDTKDLGRHLFIVVDPKNYDENGKERTISLSGPGLLGGKAEINTVKGFKNDEKALKDFQDNGIGGRIKDYQVIDVPKGMSEQEFDNAVLQNAESYDVNKSNNRYPVIGIFNQNPLGPEARNSNTFADDVIEESGGGIKDFDKAYKQNSGEWYQERTQRIYESRGWSQERMDEITRKQRGLKD
jgi:hypothetical protein